MNQPGMASIFSQLSIAYPWSPRLRGPCYQRPCAPASGPGARTPAASISCAPGGGPVEPDAARDAFNIVRLPRCNRPDLGAGALAQLDLPRPFRRRLCVPRADRHLRVVLLFLPAAHLRHDRGPGAGHDGGDPGGDRPPPAGPAAVVRLLPPSHVLLIR